MAKTKTTTTKKETSPKAEPKTMKDLLESSGYELSIPKKGETITGLVTGITRKAVLVDIGAKTEGLVAEKEYAIAKDFVDSLKVGDEIEVYVMSEENEKGQIMLSLRRAMFDKLWGMLEGYLENDKEVQVKGVEVNRGGMIVKWQGLRGFVPSSQFGAQLAGNFQDLMNKNFAVKAIEVDREKNRLIFSEKHVSEAAIMEKREKALKVVAKGEVFKGKVTGVLSFGAFVAVEVPVEKTKITVEGLVHISEISWEKVEDIHRYLKVGDAVEVKVLGVEEGTGKLNLSIKQLAHDPFLEASAAFSKDEEVTGSVARVTPYGVFMTLKNGVEGFVPISKISPNENYQIGQKITCTIESIDSKARRISLSPLVREKPILYR